MSRQLPPLSPLEQLDIWLEANENEHLEFKAAQSGFDKEKLIQYCVALANEGGGKLILGVTDRRPRSVVGSGAFGNLEKTKHELSQIVRLRVEAETLEADGKRVVVFEVPARPLGVPISYKGAYLMRSGESLVPMTPDMLKRIFAEAVTDFSATFCEGATLDDLEPSAIAEFRRLRHKRLGDSAVLNVSDSQLLEDAELILDGSVTYAALVLLGSHKGLGRHLAQAEIIFEYRSSEASIPYQERQEFRQGFLAVHDTLWELINKRNNIQSYLSGLFRNDIPTFNEDAVREAFLNAIGHRDYQNPSSVFIKQYPDKVTIVSPGGFPTGITADNILWKQHPRNRRIADALSKCNLIERSGQGMDKMVRAAIKESKPQPDFRHTDAHEVSLTLDGTVRNIAFLHFLEKVGDERLQAFSIEDLLVLDAISEEKPIPVGFTERLPHLVENGVIEKQPGKRNQQRYILSRDLYAFMGQKGTYTRKQGLDKETNKALLFKHITDNADYGSRLAELIQVLPSLRRRSVQRLLQELKREGKIHSVGLTNAARWYPKRGTED